MQIHDSMLHIHTHPPIVIPLTLKHCVHVLHLGNKTSIRTLAWRRGADVHGQHLFRGLAELPQNDGRVGFASTDHAAARRC